MTLRTALLLSVLTLASAGCGGPTVAARAPHEPHAGDDDLHGAIAAANAAPTGSSQSLAIPAADPAGPDRQVHVLLDSPAVKLVSIRLRNGAALPVHSSDLPVLIEAVSGSGTVLVDESRLPLDASRLVSLAAGVRHAVTPDAGAELVLLVHHLRGGDAAR